MPVASDLVQVAVPRELVLDVYRLIAERAEAAPSPSRVDTPDADGLPEDWSASLIRRMYRESARQMTAILDALVDRAGEVVPATDLIEVLSRSRTEPADSSVLGGTLGAFGRRVKNRYGMEQWPFSARWDADESQVMYRMSHRVAQLIRESR
jgi:hypothetical protein